MNSMAEKLNNILKQKPVFSMMSDYGKRMYLPNGITVQSNEAKQKATRYNATAGVALDHKVAMNIPSFKANFSDTLTANDIFLYAPVGGVDSLRTSWAEELVKKNPTLKGKKFSKPVVTCGITNALSVACSLFLDEGDVVVMPELYWENYDLIIEFQNKAQEVKFPNFVNGGFNINGLDKAIESVKKDKVVVILNFPNNPTGYTPTKTEMEQIAQVLKKHADNNKKIVAITDDAYFGLFFEKDVCRESLFSKTCDLSENILAIKCDGATKEEMVWGFRVGFLTYGFKGATDEELDALLKKTLGAVRGTISSCSLSAQNIILNGIKNPNHDSDKDKLFGLVEKHYKALKEAVLKHSDNKDLKMLPCNSGYFVSFETKCNADDLRHLLLDKYNIGTITINEHILRVTFSSVDSECMPDLINCLYEAASSLS